MFFFIILVYLFFFSNLPVMSAVYAYFFHKFRLYKSKKRIVIGFELVFPFVYSLLVLFLPFFLLHRFPYYDANWDVIFWEGRPFDCFDYATSKDHVCPVFPHDMMWHAETAHAYFSSRLECYNLHIPETNSIPLGGHAASDFGANNFNVERANDIAALEQLRDNLSWQVDQKAKLSEMYKKLNAERRWSDWTSYYGYWLALITLIFLIIFVILLGV